MKKINYKKQRLLVYLVTYIIVCMALYISYLFNDWQWFSRSGSLIVILGIYLTSIQIIENNRRLISRQREMRNNGNFQRDWADGNKEQIISHDPAHDTETLIMGKCGFNLLITGTLIWGFGDLLSLI